MQTVLLNFYKMWTEIMEVIIVVIGLKAMASRKCLSLEDRVKVNKSLDSGKNSRVIAVEYGVGRTQIQNVAKRKREILEEYESGNPELKRPRRAMTYDDVNELCYRWFLDATSRQLNVSGPLLKEKALKFASDLSLSDFKASNGWQNSFLKRNNIVLKVQSGERASVDNTVVDNWRKKIGEICEGYSPSDIFNMDETGLFYREGTKTTFFKKGETCAGGKRSKERITVGLCASMTGEKVMPIVIGKARRPRCFKNLNIDQLPVRYYANKKAWMTGRLMEDWLKWLDRKMKGEKRNILLFVDNAPSHPKITLKNVKLQFLPANTTSALQPMDQGIIQTLKLKYRKRQLQHALVEMDRHPTKTGPQILRDVSVLQAINWIDRAWQETESSTINKCYGHAGFSLSSDGLSVGSASSASDEVSVSDSEVECGVSAVTSVSAMVEEEDFPLSVLRAARQLFDCDLSELIDIYARFTTCDSDMGNWDRPAQDLLNESDGSDEDESATSQTSDSAPVVPPCDINEANQCIERLREFALQKGEKRLFQHILDCEEVLTDMRMKSSSVQKCITDFFK